MSSYQTIKDKIRSSAEGSGRKDLPILLAVSKKQSVEKISALYQEGQRIFGENYVQELIEKREKLLESGLQDLRFHFIGKLQSNKVKHLLPHVEAIHSVDSVKLLLEIERRAEELKLQIGVYLQINIDREESKGGFEEEALIEVRAVAQSLKQVRLLGLMAIPNPEMTVENAFQRMKNLSDLHQSWVGAGLSMGMSHDFDQAIRFGSTCVRIGSALFGARE